MPTRHHVRMITRSAAVFLAEAFMKKIIAEIDMNWDALEYQKSVKMPDRSHKNPKYNQISAETAKKIYK
jgi:hypothetical protein